MSIKPTNEQKERYLGMVLMGADPEDAAKLLGLIYADFAIEALKDPVFQIGCFGAESLRLSLKHRYERHGISGFVDPERGEGTR